MNEAATHATANGLATIDWILIGVYAVVMLALGLYFARRQKTTSEYFVGSGHMNWMLIGISLFATLLSTITYLSTPGEIISKGPADMVKLLSLPVIFLIVGYVLIPVYMRQRVTSAYELLEERLGLSHRMAAVGMFLALRLVWMSILIYMASEATVVVMGIDRSWIPVVVAVTGAVSIFYTTLGGLRAVVITDCVQTVLLFGGAILVLVIVTREMGGFAWFPSERPAHWDHQPWFSFDPRTRVTMVGSFLSLAIWNVCTAGGDQVSIQRFMATRDARAARRSFAVQLVIVFIVTATLALVGLALLAYYARFSDRLPEGMTLAKHGDKIFPLFIRQALPPGVAGLVVAAMFAAAMSSIDSGVNSITAVVLTDLLDRFGKRPETERGHMWLARLSALAIGITVVVGAIGFSQIGQDRIGNFFGVANRTVNLLVPTLFCLFFFALFVPFAHPAGVWCATIAGLTTAILIAYSGNLFGFVVYEGKKVAPVSFQWIGPASLTVDIVVGLIACRLWKAAGRNA